MAAEIGSADSLIYTRLLVGFPFLEVIKLVAKGNYDLVVKVARSPEGLGERLFGSQDLHLLRKCPCPILIDRANSGAHYQRVLAALDARPLDGQGCDEQIVALASSLSSLDQARLYVVHAWQLPGESMFRSGRFHVPSMEIDAMLEHEVLSRKQRLAERLDSAGLAVDDSRVHLVKGRAAETINRVAGDIGADIIVMGTVGRAGIPGLFIGNTAEEVLQSTTRSILAVKPQGFRSPVL